MKFFSSTGLIILASFVAGLYLPWWSLAFASFLVALLVPQKPWKAFLSGFIGGFILWGGLSFSIDLSNHHILSTKVAQILPLGGSWVLLFLITGLIAGLVAGMASLCGAYSRKIPAVSQD